jgi:VWFA-related protein
MHRPPARVSGRRVLARSERTNAWSRWLPAACSVGVVWTGVLLAAPTPAQQPTFRGGVDLVTVDVQVLDRDGVPIAALAQDRFQVTLSGKPRRVATATLVGTPFTREMEEASAPSPSSRLGPTVAATGGPSIELPPIVLAFDCLSFAPGSEARVVALAREFVSRVAPAQRVGLIAYPIGPKVNPTTDRPDVIAVMPQIRGQKGVTRLRASEIVDGSLRPCISCPPDADPYMQAQELEAQGRAQLGALEDLMRDLGKVPARKIVVLVSAGMVVSDRIGYRPDLSEGGIEVGRVAAQSNVTIYSLFIDQNFLGAMSAEHRSAPPRNQPITRDSNILARMVDQVSGASGGDMIRALTDDGASAFRRLLRETSAYYLLGVEVADEDRDGKMHELKVKVDAPGATVRGRAVVLVPKRTT